MLQVSHLVKSFGSLRAVDDVSFEVPKGSIVGMIGQNGSGKTTIFRMILDFLTPEEGGQVTWKGEEMGSQLYNIVGYLPEERGLYEKMTIEQQVSYFAQLRGLKRPEILEALNEWMELLEVKGDIKDKISTLSKGNQQKVQLIATLIHRPELVILDEPFSGLDPVNADLLKKAVKMLKDQGSAIIFSSHNMNNVEELCDKLVMILRGKQVLYGGLQEIRESFGRTNLYIECNTWSREDLLKLEGVLEVRESSPKHFSIRLSDPSYGPDLFQRITKGEYIPAFIQQPPTLEEIFKMKAGENNE